MTAPARQGASSGPGAVPAPPAPARPSADAAGETAAEAARAAAERRQRRRDWVGVIALMVVATGLTVTILLLQWMSTSSGTVAR
jgi:hypothetical protein